MITENEIIEIMELKFGEFFSEWIPKELWGLFNFRLPVQTSAKTIIDKINIKGRRK